MKSLVQPPGEFSTAMAEPPSRFARPGRPQAIGRGPRGEAQVGRIPGHSGGTAADSHRIPRSPRLVE
jgi:hypothetical protein